MADGVTMKIEGLGKIDAALRELEKKMERKIVRQAVRAGAKIAQAEIKTSAPEKSGVLKRSVTVRARKKRRRGEFSMNVLLDTRKYPQLVSYSTGSRSSLKTHKLTGKRYFYPAALEYGTTKNPNIKTKGWMRKAWDRKKRTALAMVLRKMRSGIEREAQKR